MFVTLIRYLESRQRDNNNQQISDENNISLVLLIKQLNSLHSYSLHDTDRLFRVRELQTIDDKNGDDILNNKSRFITQAPESSDTYYHKGRNKRLSVDSFLECAKDDGMEDTKILIDLIIDEHYDSDSLQYDLD